MAMSLAMNLQRWKLAWLGAWNFLISMAVAVAIGFLVCPHVSAACLNCHCLRGRVAHDRRRTRSCSVGLASQPSRLLRGPARPSHLPRCSVCGIAAWPHAHRGLHAPQCVCVPTVTVASCCRLACVASLS